MSRGPGALQQHLLQLVSVAAESPIRIGGASIAPAGSSTTRRLAELIWGVDKSRRYGGTWVLNCTSSQRAHLNRAIAGLLERGFVSVGAVSGIQDERIEDGIRVFGWTSTTVVAITTKGREVVSGGRMSDVVDIKSAKGPRKAKPREPSNDWRDALLYNRDGAIEPTVANVITVLANAEEWAGVFVFDEFGQVITAERVPPWDESDAPPSSKPGEWTDSDTIRTQAWLARHYQLKVARETVYDAVRVLSEKRVINPPRDWLEGLRWDGVRRVDGWLVNYLGAKPSPYVTSVGRWMLISAIARIMRPGCKVDTMLVLEGAQGIRKSTSLRVLFSDRWFSDTPLDLNSKDRFVGLRHNLCHEFAELDAFGRAEIARVKSFLSSQTDDFRPPYGKSNVKVERRCIFVGTVNDSEYLKDPTGNRRFLPVRCGKIDIPSLERDREQLMVEAREMFASGERWWPEGDEVGQCETAQAARTTHDAWAELISGHVERERKRNGDKTFVTVGEILEGALGIEKGKWGQSEQNRIARCLTELRWQKVRRRRSAAPADKDNRVHGYVPPGVDLSLVADEPGTGPGTGETQ